MEDYFDSKGIKLTVPDIKRKDRKTTFPRAVDVWNSLKTLGELKDD